MANGITKTVDKSNILLALEREYDQLLDWQTRNDKSVRACRENATVATEVLASLVSLNSL
jgi:hypothetical protein